MRDLSQTRCIYEEDEIERRGRLQSTDDTRYKNGKYFKTNGWWEEEHAVCKKKKPNFMIR